LINHLISLIGYFPILATSVGPSTFVLLPPDSDGNFKFQLKLLILLSFEFYIESSDNK